MNFVKKFYETAEVETGAGLSIVELMAKEGKVVESGFSEPQSIKRNNEQQTETKVDVPAATASAETKVEEVVQETKPPVVEVPVTESKPTVEPTSTTVTWQEVLKQTQPDTVLKELLGVDDKKIGLVNTLKDLPDQMVWLLETWKSNGDLSAYLKEMTTDYSKMSSEDVMRSQLRLEYPKATEKAIEALFKKEIVETFRLDPDKYSDDEVEEGKLLLDAKADKYRDTLVERQKQFLIPKAPEAAAIVPDNSEQELANENFEVYRKQVSSDPYTQNVFTNKQISIGEGDERFNFPVDPSAITDILFNNEKWVESINNVSLDTNGKKVFTPDIQKQMILGAFAKYGTAFLDEYAKHFKTIGAKKVIDPLDNAKRPVNNNSSESVIAPKTAAEAMAKGGRIV